MDDSDVESDEEYIQMDKKSLSCRGEIFPILAPISLITAMGIALYIYFKFTQK